MLEWLSRWATLPTGAMRGLRPVKWAALYKHVVTFMALDEPAGGLVYGEDTPVLLCARAPP